MDRLDRNTRLSMDRSEALNCLVLLATPEGIAYLRTTGIETVAFVRTHVAAIEAIAPAPETSTSEPPFGECARLATALSQDLEASVLSDAALPARMREVLEASGIIDKEAWPTIDERIKRHLAL
jgi:hypothetical protein